MAFINQICLAIGNTPNGSGTGTPADPYIVNTPETFASIMRENASVPANSAVRLGPGVFRTRGIHGNGFDKNIVVIDKIWVPKPGQRIIGSGMWATTLQFVWDFDLPDEQYEYKAGQKPGMVAVLPDSYLTSFELSDLTLDCNLQHVPEPFGPTLYSDGTIASTSGSDNKTVVTTVDFFLPSMVGSTLALLNSSGTVLIEKRIMSYTDARHVTISGPSQTITNAALKV